MNKITEEYKEAYEKAPYFIDLFCKVLNVKKGRYLFRRYKENKQYEYEIWRVWDRAK